MTGQPGGFAAEDLRALVREVLLEALPEAGLGPTAEPTDDPGDSGGTSGTDERWVAVDNDDDLTELVRTVARECRDAERREELADGRVRYRVAATPASTAEGTEPAEPVTATPAPEPERPVLRVDHGAVTERHVREAGRTGATIVAARGVVTTPLARDRARSIGIDIEKEH